MLLVLFNESKFGWIIFFSLMVLLPLLFGFIFINNSSIFYGFLWGSLGLFYFYCFLLRFTVNDWIREKNWKEQRVQQKLNDEMYKDTF
ncbi:hypothetical protein BMS3Abin04_00391 [bacterium BMS3Abin04]|nr:hypothetical protein BMS3Abin04_00391 [bacterium BMS3Abin04]